MNESISLTHYLDLCRSALEKNKPEDVNAIYTLLKARHPEFTCSFKVRFQTTILNHYRGLTVNDVKNHVKIVIYCL